MRLYLDAHQAQERPYERGLPRYVANHVCALAARGDVVSRVAVDAEVPLPPRLREDRRVTELLCSNSMERFEGARREGTIAYHVMSPFHWSFPLDENVPPWAVDADVPLVVTLYDLFPLIEPERYLLPPFDRVYLARLALVASADLVLAISHYVAEEAIDRLGVDPERIAVIGAGFDPFFAEPPSDDDGHDPHGFGRLHGLERPFAMAVSYSDARKNAAGLVRAWATLPDRTRREHQLVVVGNLEHGDAADALRRVADDAGLRADDVVVVGAVDDSALRWLYRHTQALVCPSLAEGFGLPVIEAGAAGAPAITSDRTSLPEILDFPPATFDPTSVESIAAVLDRTLTDDGFRELLTEIARLAAARHTWEAVATRSYDAVQRLD